MIERKNLVALLKKAKDQILTPFNKYNGTYTSYILLGDKTENFEYVKYDKKFKLFTDINAEFITTRVVKGINMISNWNDDTNASVELISDEKFTKIKINPQFMRGYSWDIYIYY